MMRLALTVLCLGTAAAVLLLIGSFQRWGRAPLARRGEPAAFSAAVEERIREKCRGNAVVALIRDGAVHHEYAWSVGEPVDGQDLFQVASLSKWISAWGVMALVEAGRIGLDVPVVDYLTRWQLPESDFDVKGATVRRLLSHTAGLTDGLGYLGFEPGEPIQTLEESLTRATDAAPHASGVVAVGQEPGSRWEYSGGGYTLLQLLVEEVTGESFESYMQRVVLGPLGMRHSTFDWRRAERSKLAEFYDADSSRAIHYRFTGLAAASLYTSVSDLTVFVRAHLPGPDGEPIGRGVLAPETVEQMRTPQASRLGREIWGLGATLYVRSGEGGFVIGHDGNNAPAINTAVRLDPVTGNGIIVLATGARALATTIAGEWVFWETGNVDIVAFMFGLECTLQRAAAAGVGIALGAMLLAWRRLRAGGAGGGSPRTRSDHG